MPKLKPCPFCGNAAEVKQSTTQDYYYAMCSECIAFGPGSNTKSGAAKRWNDRSDAKGGVNLWQRIMNRFFSKKSPEIP
jgi:Lar family restriction alleviation protein